MMNPSHDRLLFLPAKRWRSDHDHVPSLDGLRAASILVVLAGHLALPERFSGVSALGLKIFFFVSGFIITRLLLAEFRNYGRINLSSFYVRRVLRLYPALIVFMSAVLVTADVRDLNYLGIDAASVFLYFTNYLLAARELSGSDLTLPIGVLWSLSVEEHFYLVVPFALVLARCNPRRILLFALLICLVCLALRVAYALIWPDVVDTLWIYRRSETRADSIAYGVLLAALAETGFGRTALELLSSRWAFAVAFAVLLLSFLLRDPFFKNTFRFSIQGLCLMPICAGVIFRPAVPLFSKLLNSSLMSWIGRLSYSIYIWHAGTEFLILPLLQQLVPAMALAVTFAATLLLAVTSYYFIERPALRLRRIFT